jgi:hypothetical protein
MYMYVCVWFISRVIGKWQKKKKEAVQPKRYMNNDLVFDGRKKNEKKFFTELKREFNNIIITVKDNCLYTNKHTNTHTHTHFYV